MGVVEEINKLHISVKTLGFGFLFVMPIWFIDIFLFNRVFFNSNPIYIPIVFSFVLTTCWLIICIVIAGLVFVQDKDSDTFLISIIIAILFLSLITMVVYFNTYLSN